VAVVLGCLATTPAGLASSGVEPLVAAASDEVTEGASEALPVLQTAVSRQYHPETRVAADPTGRPAAAAGEGAVPARLGAASTAGSVGPGRRATRIPIREVRQAVHGGRRYSGPLYHTGAISRRSNFAVSLSIAHAVGGGAVGLPNSSDTSNRISFQNRSGNPTTNAPQATASPRAAELARELDDRRLMLQIGAGLGVAYVAFLILWFWATRFRPRLQRST
jgi:hypothetical protein